MNQPTSPAEPGTLDAVPAFTPLKTDDLEQVRAICVGGESHVTCEYTRVEDDGDGYLTLYLVGNEDLVLYGFRMPMLIGQALSAQLAETYRTSDPATRAKLVHDLTDRGYASSQMQRERQKEAVMAQARKAPPAPPPAPGPTSITGLHLRERLMGLLSR